MIHSHTAIALSDGSYKNGYGAAAWVLEGDNKHGRISGAAIVPGEGVDHSSYRSEVTGLYCIILIITRLVEYHKVEEGTITVGCDGQSALVTVFSRTILVMISSPPHLPSYQLPAFAGCLSMSRDIRTTTFLRRNLIVGHG